MEPVTEKDIVRFLGELLVASGCSVVQEPRYHFPDGQQLVADIVATTPEGDLLVFEVGRDTPARRAQMDALEHHLGIRPILVDPGLLAKALSAYREGNLDGAAAVMNDHQPWYVRLVGAARGAASTIGRNVVAVLGRLRVIDIRLGTKTTVERPGLGSFTTDTGLVVHLEFRDPAAPK